ncbi:hypothetical protein CFELI_06885 [Corynebacterium felinum]|nr:hypothetical protein CFELI_06885 [Corynebacterium felinum]
MIQARIRSFLGIQMVVLVRVPRMVLTTASATIGAVTDIGAGFMPRVMVPITNPGRAITRRTGVP